MTQPGALGAVGRAAHTLVSPIERAVNAVASPVSDWFDGVTDGGSLKRENRRLTTEVQRLQNQERDAKTAIEQNETLQALLDLPVLKEVPRVTARVVNRSPGNFEWTVTLNKGEESGISPDMPVIGPDGSRRTRARFLEGRLEGAAARRPAVERRRACATGVGERHRRGRRGFGSLAPRPRRERRRLPSATVS